jgi:hypothetical protein
MSSGMGWNGMMDLAEKATDRSIGRPFCLL